MKKTNYIVLFILIILFSFDAICDEPKNEAVHNIGVATMLVSIPQIVIVLILLELNGY